MWQEGLFLALECSKASGVKSSHLSFMFPFFRYNSRFFQPADSALWKKLLTSQPWLRSPKPWAQGMIGLNESDCPLISLPRGLSQRGDSKGSFRTSYFICFISFHNRCSPFSCFFFFVCLFFFVFFSRAPPTAYGGSQARGLIGAIAAGLCQSHSNMESKLHVWPTPQVTAMLHP